MINRHFHRRNLPHLYYNEGIYFITFRLYGSIHPEELIHLKQLGLNKNPDLQRELFERYDLLKDRPLDNIQFLIVSEILEIYKSAIHYFDTKEYKLICYSIMPNHIHIVLELLSKEKNVGDIMGSVKKYSARRANKILKKDGAFWQSESFDRLIRDDAELYFTIKYVLLNPVNAGLTDNWKNWKGNYCNPEFEVID